MLNKESNLTPIFLGMALLIGVLAVIMEENEEKPHQRFQVGEYVKIQRKDFKDCTAQVTGFYEKISEGHVYSVEIMVCPSARKLPCKAYEMGTYDLRHADLKPREEQLNVTMDCSYTEPTQPIGGYDLGDSLAPWNAIP